MENFDIMAENYDTEVRKKRAKAIAEQLQNNILDGKYKTAIEFGCGTGLVGFELIDNFESLIFMDSSAGMIQQVEQKLSNMNNQTSSAICCNLQEQEPKDLIVDYIFSTLVLHHIIDTKDILSRLYSLLKMGGHLLVVDLDKEDGSFHAKYPDFDGHNGFEQSHIINVAEKVGFTKVRIETFYYDSKIVNGEHKQYSLFILDAEK